MRIKKLPVFLLLIAFSLVCCFGVKSFPSKRINSIQTIITDMQSPHQGKPHGVPDNYDWARGPRIGMGNDPKGFKAAVAWGQLYEAAEGNTAVNSRVQIRNIKAYLLSKRDRRWHLLQSSEFVEGSAFREDFAGNINQSANIRYEPEGGISVKTGQGSNFHFWTKGKRAAIDPKDVDGIFTTVQA
ncbi:MAG: hypothetical protein WCA35_30275, partial [Kovacikia sp.]